MSEKQTQEAGRSAAGARKWVIAAVLVAVLAAGWLAWRGAWSDRPHVEKRVELVLAVKSSPDIRPVYQALIDRFEQRNPGITVKLLEIPGAVFYQKVLVMLAGRTPPDVMWMG